MVAVGCDCRTTAPPPCGPPPACKTKLPPELLALVELCEIIYKGSGLPVVGNCEILGCTTAAKNSTCDKPRTILPVNSAIPLKLVVPLKVALVFTANVAPPANAVLEALPKTVVPYTFIKSVTFTVSVDPPSRLR